MKNINQILIVILLLISSCGIPQKEFDELKTENQKLLADLEDCQFGADKLLNKAKSYIETKDFANSKIELNLLLEKHPGSNEAITAKELLENVNVELDKFFAANKKAKEDRLKKEKTEETARINKEKLRLANATKKLNKKYDEINEVTWYRDKNSPAYVNYNGFYAYIGQSKGSNPWLRLAIQYAADDWLFIEKYIIKVDGATYTIAEESYGEIKTDNGSGGIWEWLDRQVDATEFEIIKAVANGKDVKIRFSGKDYYKDKTITNQQKLALKNILDAYEALGGTMK
jgi:hypothetical protein